MRCDSGGQVLKQLNRCALGATLLGTFDNGRVEVFIDHAVTLTHTDLQQRHLRLAVARRLRAVHDCQVRMLPTCVSTATTPSRCGEPQLTAVSPVSLPAAAD
jgi:thiamine kinase-like enzyme